MDSRVLLGNSKVVLSQTHRERERERERENHLLINQGIFLREKNIWNCYNALFFNRVTIETLKKIELEWLLEGNFCVFTL